MGFLLKATHTETYEIWKCCSCDAAIALSAQHERSARESGASFWCARGHSQAFTETDAGRLRKKLEEQTREATRQAARAFQAQQERDAEATLRAKAERKLKRVQRGVCPDCNRTFTNLARHMCSQHTKPSGSVGAKPLPK